MFYLSSSFPYGKGEKTFIMPELKGLAHEYDITLISHAYDDELTDLENKSEVASNVSVMHFSRSTSLFQKMFWGICFFFDVEGRQEFRYILKGGKHFLARLYQSIGFYILTRKELSNIRKAGICLSGEIVCYSFWYTYYCYAFLKLQKKHPNIRVITRTHGVDLYNERIQGLRQPFREIMDKKLEGVIFAADYAKQYYIKHYTNNVNKEKYVVCKLGVPKAEKQMKREENSFCMVSCSNAIPLKRIEYIIYALAILCDERIFWVHIGDGESLTQLKSIAKEKLGNKDNIEYEFKGYLNNKDVHMFYKENNVGGFITTSSTEGGCPVSIQEAMSYGIPIIGTAVGGITEMIHENGFLLPKEPQYEDIANAIKDLYYLDKKEWEKMSNNSYINWLEEYSVDTNVKKMMDAIHNLTESW